MQTGAPAALPAAAAPGPAANAGGPAAAPIGPGSPVPAGPANPQAPAPRELYTQAYADYARGNYDLAIQEYSEYLRNYPDTSGHAGGNPLQTASLPKPLPVFA